MKLLIEQIDFEQVEFITEEAEGRKLLYIKGPFLQAEQKNRNGRIYRKTLLEREVGRYTKEKIDRRCAWGELGHPDTPTINLDRTAIRIVELKQNNNDWHGKAIIVEGHPYGDMVKALINSGGIVGVSSRGVGTVKLQENTKLVQDDFHLATPADVVADPSAPDAFVESLLEQKEWVWQNGIISEADIAKIYKEVKTAKRVNLEETMINSFKNFLEKL